MTPDKWIDLLKWCLALFGPLGILYAGAVQYLNIIRSRPAPDDKTSKMLAEILQKMTESFEKDSGARLGRMQDISSVLEQLAKFQLGIAQDSIKSQSHTETLHKMTWSRIDGLGEIVGPGLQRIEHNQVTINDTIEKSIERLGERLAGKLAA